VADVQKGTPGWPIQDIVLCLGLCARINTFLCEHTLCSGTPPHPVIAHTIAQCNVSPRPPVIAIYHIQYWQWQYRVKAKLLVVLSSGLGGATARWIKREISRGDSTKPTC